MSDDLYGALTERTTSIAGAYASRYVRSNRLYVVTLWRGTAPEPEFDRATEVFTPIPKTVIYSGPARVTPLRPSQVIDLGDTPSYWGAVRVSIEVTDLDPRIDDMLVVNDNKQSRRARIVGKMFRVTGLTEGGQMPIGYSLDCVGVQPSVENPEDG